METRAHYLLIGTFTLIGAASALLFALWLARYGTDREMQAYDILFREPVSGLSVGSPVQYSGIRVGDVQSLTLDPEDPRRVWARINVSATTPIRTDTEAALTLLNITGSSGISLSEGSPENPRLTDPSRGIPVIEAEPSPLARLRGDTDELLVQVTTLLENANRILSEDNADRLGRILDNLDSVSSQLVEQQDTLGSGLEALAASGEQLQTLLARVDRELLERGGPLMDRAGEAIVQIRDTAQQLERLVDENSSAVGSGLQSLEEVGPAIRDLRRLIDSLRTVSEGLEANPGGLLLGEEPIQEYQP